MDKPKFAEALSKIVSLNEIKDNFVTEDEWFKVCANDCFEREIVKAARELIDAAGEIENVENKPPAEYVTDIKFHGNGTVDVFYNGDNVVKTQYVYERKFPQ